MTNGIFRLPSLDAGAGTRFQIFPQPAFLPGYETPETVILRGRPGSIGPGPTNQRMYVADALMKTRPYGAGYLPPSTDICGAGAVPGSDGHFDHLEPLSRAFGAAQLFATVNLVLNAWEGYVGRPIAWHFGQVPLELVPYVEWDNAHAGWGYLETGYGEGPDGTVWPFAMSFDVVAHEVGHLVLYSELGLPNAESSDGQFGGFHEATADLIAIVSLLLVPGMARRILDHARGDLYGANELSRFGELSPSAEIRRADNRLTLDMANPADIHALSMVLAGAYFDILAEAYLLNLSLLGMMDEGDVARARSAGWEGGADAVLAQRLAAELSVHRPIFERALAGARDFVGRRMALSWSILRPDAVTYSTACWAFLEADAILAGDRANQDWISSSFAWRGIAPVPPTMTGSRGLPRLRRRASGFHEPADMAHSCQLRAERRQEFPSMTRFAKGDRYV